MMTNTDAMVADPEVEWVTQGGSKYRAMEEIARRLRQWLIDTRLDPNAGISFVKPSLYLKFHIAFKNYEIRISEHDSPHSYSDFNIVFGKGPNIDDAMIWIWEKYCTHAHLTGTLSR